MTAVCVLAALSFAASAQQPPPAPAPAPPSAAVPSVSEQEAHLKIDMGSLVARAVAQMLATPRFEEQVEVRDRFQESLDRYLGSGAIACGATESASPARDAMNGFRAHPVPPTADLLAGLRWLHGKMKGVAAKKPPRFFLYWVRSKSAPERFVYVVREGPVSENDRASVPGTEWELLTSFVDAGKAAETLARLQRGISPPSRPEASRGAGLWAVPRCGR